MAFRYARAEGRSAETQNAGNHTALQLGSLKNALISNIISTLNPPIPPR